MSSAIVVDNYVWARSSNFRITIIGNAFWCFTPGSLFEYPLKVCSNNNDNDPYKSLLGSYLKYALKAWDRYPMVSLTVAATSLLFGTWTFSACLTACAKSNNTSCLWQRLNPSRKTSLLRPIDHRNLYHLSQARIRLSLVLSTFAFYWAVTAEPSREKSWLRWGPVTVKNRGEAG